jgi:hypothetical protein
MFWNVWTGLDEGAYDMFGALRLTPFPKLQPVLLLVA